MLPGFLNLDIEPLTPSPGIAFLQWDLRSGLPAADGSVDFANASHVIEHFAWPDAMAVIQHVHRVLVPGGRLRVAVPDLALLVAAYQAGKMDGFAAVQPAIYRQVQSSGLRLSFLLLGNNGHDCTREHYTGHQLLLDQPSLTELLVTGGFPLAGIRRVPFNAQYDAPNTENHSLVMEAQKED